MKKWIVIAAVLILCGLYVMVKFANPQSQNANGRVEDTPIEGRPNVGDTNEAPPAKSPGSGVSPTQVEAVTKALKEFQSCLKNEKYEQAWQLTSEFFKQRVSNGSFEKFKENMAGEGAALATAAVHPESAIAIEGRVGLLVTDPAFEYDLYLCFIEDNGQWKLDIGRPAHSVDASKQ
jgi:hypothetical protein